MEINPSVTETTESTVAAVLVVDNMFPIGPGAERDGP